MTVSTAQVLDSLRTTLPEMDVERLLEAAIHQASLPPRSEYAADEVSAIAQAILTLAGRELAEAPPQPTLNART